MNYELVIFDWDGTLVDSLGKIVSCMQHAAVAVGEQKRSDVEVKDIIGLELNEAIAVLYPNISNETISEMRDHYSRMYIDLERDPTCFFAGIPEMLLGLRRQSRLLGVATGKSRRGLDRVMDSLAANDFFHATRCADETRGKPHPDMVLELLNTLEVKPGRAVMVGDSAIDLEMAARAGVESIGVGWGAHEANFLRSRFPGTRCVETVGALERYLGL